jgi:hypothetical protein
LSADGRPERRSLPPGIFVRRGRADVRYMSAAALVEVAPAASERLLADVHAFDGPDERADKRAPALTRLEATLGREFTDRLVAALSSEAT